MDRLDDRTPGVKQRRAGFAAAGAPRDAAEKSQETDKPLRSSWGAADQTGMSENTATVMRVAPVSRAVVRRIEPGNMAVCVHCALPVKFAAKLHKLQVIANVYVDGRWDRVEHFHEECYDEATTPYGEVDASNALKTRRA
jgi:hypothetical protein